MRAKGAAKEISRLAEIGRQIHQPVSSVFVGASFPVACAVAVCLSCSGATDNGSKRPDKPHKPDNPVSIDAGIDAATEPIGGEAIHSMVLFGDKRVYLSHIAQFEPPYDYEVVFEAKLRATHGDENPLDVYHADRRRYDEDLYTVVPEAFEIDELKSGTSNKPFRFAAGVYRGHFEHGGVNILDVEIEVVRVIHFRRLDPAAARSDSYRAILVGSPPGQFAVHYVGGRPSFEQIVKVSGGPKREGVVTAVGRDDAEPLKQGSRAKVRVGEGKRSHTLRVDVDIYVEEGSLDE